MIGQCFCVSFLNKYNETVDFFIPEERWVSGLGADTEPPTPLPGPTRLEGRGAGTQLRSHGDSEVPTKVLGPGWS